MLGFYFWLLMSLYQQAYVIWLPLQLLWIFTFWKTAERLCAFEMASRSGLAKIAKPTADYMSQEHENNVEIHPSSMRGYKYLLEDPISGKNDYVTMEKLWQCEDDILSSRDKHGKELKDICLSFALFKLLLRRFSGYPIHEASQKKTWKFVRYGLLNEEDQYDRPFKVIEGELQFVYDLFYTKYYMLSTFDWLWFRICQIVILISMCIWVYHTLIQHQFKQKYPTSKMNIAHILDVTVTTFAFVMLTVLEFLQFTMLLLSDWTTVKRLVIHVKTQTLNWCQKIILKYLVPIALKVRQYDMFRPWERKLGQYSFLDNYARVHILSCLAKYTSSTRLISKMTALPRIGQIRDSSIKLSWQVKVAVIESLKTYNDDNEPPKLTNGITSLERNRVYSKLSWACLLETQAHIVYVWHIATTICEWSTQSKELQKDFHFVVATSLSKYCAYLVTFAPDLLSEHPHTTECIFSEIVSQAWKDIGENATKETKIQKLLEVNDEDPIGSTALKQAGLLAKTLLNQVQDNALIWKVLADFWAELILFMAPSDKAEAHAEHLARGGEFITHLWALLTHAGILKASSS